MHLPIYQRGFDGTNPLVTRGEKVQRSLLGSGCGARVGLTPSCIAVVSSCHVTNLSIAECLSNLQRSGISSGDG